MYDKLRKVARIEIEAFPEIMSVTGYYTEYLEKGTEDYKSMREYEIKVRNRARTNVWAWCTVRVTAFLGPVFGDDYLGGCSYRNEKDFIQNSGYYEDMVKTALAELAKQLRSLSDE